MPAFEHLSVLVSIVVGMAVSQLLCGLGQLMRRQLQSGSGLHPGQRRHPAGAG
jgi:hypothetical protein